mmetsp:Transcript_342/g.888  ORF Transcript_342/g.888 Transcript_342/m.888 type:complete len:109 (-) Transcript_342:37-363(-)
MDPIGVVHTAGPGRFRCARGLGALVPASSSARALARWLTGCRHGARRIAQEEVKKARIPMANRDYCVDSLIPLNECRRENYYLPWKCEHERHAYELCQYKLYKLRTQK